MLRPGDPEGIERIMKGARTFRDLFLSTAPGGHTHFAGNHLSATQIAIDPNHRADIPLLVAMPASANGGCRPHSSGGNSIRS